MRSSRRTRGHSRSSTSTCWPGARSIDDAREERFRRLFAAAGASEDVDRVRRTAAAYREAYLAARRPVEGALAVLAALKPRVRIAIVTNNLLDEQQAKITLCGFDCYVDALVVSEVVGVSKPRPGDFHASARGSRVSGVRRGDGRRLVGRRHRGRARRGDSADLVQPLRSSVARSDRATSARSRRCRRLTASCAPSLTLTFRQIVGPGSGAHRHRSRRDEDRSDCA